jgi:DNA repair protein RadC
MPMKKSSSIKIPENIDIVKVMLIKDMNSPYRARPIGKSQQVASIAKNFLAGEDREVFIAINLDRSHKVNSIHVVSVGSGSAAVVEPKEVFKTAILSNASSVILAHNHPSGNSEPSDLDKQMTCKLFGWGDFLEIKVLDHIIIGDDKYSSCDKFEGKDGKKQILWTTQNFEDNQ